RSATAASALRSLKTNTVPAFGTTVLVPRVLSMAKGRISAVLSPGPPLAYRAPRLAERGGSRLNSAAQGQVLPLELFDIAADSHGRIRRRLREGVCGSGSGKKSDGEPC